MLKGFFVSGINTEVGKTLCSALLVEALEADYWKPVQTGADQAHPGDRERVEELVSSLPGRRFFPEAYRLPLPASPHQAARVQGLRIETEGLELPSTPRPLVVEGAGGLLVPLNEKTLLIDLIARWELPVVLVVRLYLGCINHTLLSLEALERRRIPVAGLIFNGDSNPDSESFILSHSGLPCLLRLPWQPSIDAAWFARQAAALRTNLSALNHTLPT